MFPITDSTMRKSLLVVVLLAMLASCGSKPVAGSSLTAEEWRRYTASLDNTFDSSICSRYELYPLNGLIHEFREGADRAADVPLTEADTLFGTLYIVAANCDRHILNATIEKAEKLYPASVLNYVDGIVAALETP